MQVCLQHQRFEGGADALLFSNCITGLRLVGFYNFIVRKFANL